MEEEETILKVDDVIVKCNTTLEDLYMGDVTLMCVVAWHRFTPFSHPPHFSSLLGAMLQEMLFYEDGESTIDGESGDLRFCILTAPHGVFRWEGNDLQATVTITLIQDLIGFETSIKYLDEKGADLTYFFEPLEKHKSKASEEVQRRGMPLDMRKEKRDLYVAFEVLFATSLTEEQKTTIKKKLLSIQYVLNVT
ncbi:DnaJ carboxy-terminal domain protein [Medicago truncatula]|uniref:DnaJ carboxy-terminal domain protein n=1 Tax=Medicago truncatula TaxID=3880 RepID=G7IDU9_MEDTR|nr:DnaJ carboxy-terminal domain protein [Medicago truncatula]